MARQALGWDLHRRFSRVTLMEQPDPLQPQTLKVVRRERLEHHDRQAMRNWLNQVSPGTPVAMEGSFGWQWVADLLAELGFEPHLGHPPAIKVLAKNEAKADRPDADRLARFWLRGIFPECYLSSPEVRQIRERVRYRMALASSRTQLKNRVHAILHRQGILHDFSDLFCPRGRKFLAALTVPEATRYVLDHWLSMLDSVEALLADVERWMQANLEENAIVKLLQTLPGVGLILAHVIRAEVGEMSRFAGQRKFAAYAGLAPLSNDSADRHGERHIAAACNHALRWAFIEAAGSMIRSKNCPRKLRSMYYRLSRGGGIRTHVARVAVARELAELVYVLWKKGEPYREMSSPDKPR
jgi:transposase